MLQIHGNKLTSNAAVSVAKMLKESSLSTLCFIDIAPKHEKEINILITALPKSKIATLEFKGCVLSDNNIKTMADNLLASQITNLGFVDVKLLTSRGLKSIVDALPKSKVKIFYLCNTKISDNAIKILADYLHQSQLDIFYYTAKLDIDCADLVFKALLSENCQVQKVVLGSELHTEVANNMISWRRVMKQPDPSTSVGSASARPRSNSASSDEPVFYDCPSH